MAARADAVMLNKGPHAAAVVRGLADVLKRMHRHHNKKSARLGVLKSLTSFDPSKS
jgi:pyruvate kinase